MTEQLSLAFDSSNDSISVNNTAVRQRQVEDRVYMHVHQDRH